MQYDVYLFPVVRVKVCGVEADSQPEAIAKAEAMVDLYEAVRGAEFADDVAYYLVDETGDDNHLRSRWHTWKGEGYCETK